MRWLRRWPATGDFARTHSQTQAFQRAKEKLLDPEYCLIRWWCRKWNVPPTDTATIHKLSFSRLWIEYVEDEITAYLAEHPTKKIEDLKPGDLWLKEGDSVKAIYMRLRERHPDRPIDALLKQARAIYQAQERKKKS